MKSYDVEYYMDEVREGFYVPGMIKKSWAVQMDVLSVIDDICKKYNLKWYADYGTLIGAVRHKGFIPWDDDLDICMMRKDFNKFLEVIADEKPEGYKILSMYHENEYEMFLARLVNSEKILFSDEHLKNNHQFIYVAGVDIFPIDNMFDDEEKEKERVARAKKLWEIAGTIKLGIEDKDSILIRNIERLSGIKYDKKFCKFNNVLKALDAVYSECKDENTKYVANMYFFVNDGNHKYLRKYYDYIVELPFEKITINAPVAFSEMMRLNYGEWWKINRKGGIHDYPFFTGQEDTFSDAANIPLPYRYFFKDEDLTPSRINEVPKNEMISIINSAHILIKRCIDNNEAEEALQLLIKCQTLMITVGNQIEEEKGEGLTTVKHMENYCESIYELHEAIGTGSPYDINEKYLRLLSIYNEVSDSYNSDYAGVNDVIFLPFSAKYWSSMDKMYREELEKGERVRVIPLPFFEKSFIREVIGEYYDVSEYPSDIQIEDYRKCNINNKYFKKIYIQNPYDEYNATITVPMDFYAKNLINHTKELIYAPYFDIDNISSDDEKAAANTKYYIETPGVVYADKIILNSKELKETYVDVLTKMSNESLRQIWENKILIDNKIDTVKHENKVEGKKNILFYTSISDMYSKGKDYIEKLKSIVNIFEQSKDSVNVSWLQEYNFEKNAEEMCSDIYDDYKCIADYFIENKVGNIYTEEELDAYNKTVEHLIKNADAYYGAGGYVMNQCVRKKVPVMVWDISCK